MKKAKSFVATFMLSLSLLALPLSSVSADWVPHFSFQDVDPDEGEIGGTIVWNALPGEDFDNYMIAFMDDSSALTEVIVENVPKGQTQYSVQISDVEIPEDATRLAIYMVTDDVVNPTAPYWMGLSDYIMEEPTPFFSFNDTNPNPGLLSGTVGWYLGDFEQHLDSYTIAFADANDDLVEVIVGNISKTGSPIYHNISDVLIHEDATRIAIYITQNSVFNPTPALSMNINDFVALPIFLNFTDTNATTGVLSGDIEWSFAMFENDFDAYTLGFADASGNLIEVIEDNIVKTGAAQSFTLTNAVIPTGASRIAVYIVNGTTMNPTPPMSIGSMDLTS